MPPAIIVGQGLAPAVWCGIFQMEERANTPRPTVGIFCNIKNPGNRRFFLSYIATSKKI